MALLTLKVKSLSCVRLFVTPWPMRFLHPWNFPGKSTGVGCHFLLQGIFLTESMSPALQVDSLLQSHWGSPIIRLYQYCQE